MADCAGKVVRVLPPAPPSVGGIAAKKLFLSRSAFFTPHRQITKGTSFSFSTSLNSGARSFTSNTAPSYFDIRPAAFSALSAERVRWIRSGFGTSSDFDKRLFYRRRGVVPFHKQWGIYPNNPLVVEQGMSMRMPKLWTAHGKGGGLVDGDAK
jgi:hypothetical protein